MYSAWRRNRTRSHCKFDARLLPQWLRDTRNVCTLEQSVKERQGLRLPAGRGSVQVFRMVYLLLDMGVQVTHLSMAVREE